MKEKQQQLLFDKGITNVPSDALCSDNALEESLGMVYDNGEHRVIQKPASFMTPVSGELVYIHKDRYIFKVLEGNQYKLKYRTESSGTMYSVCNIDGGDISVTSIGKTLIINTSSGLKYVLWDNGYKLMGESLPEISVRFSLSQTEAKPVTYYNDRYVDAEGMIDSEERDFPTQNMIAKTIAYHFYVQNKEEDAKNAIIGLVAKRLNKVKEDKRFAFPFWVRFAIRLYDGSHTHISDPVLMMPTARHNCNVFLCRYGDHDGESYVPGEIENNYTYNGGTHFINYLPESAELEFEVSAPQGIEQWYDVIKGIDVFVSREARGFDIDDNWEIVNPDIRSDSSQPENHNQVLVDGCWPESIYPSFVEKTMESTPLTGIGDYNYYASFDDECFGCYIKPTHYNDSEIIQNLIDNSTFYKLFELNIQDLPSGQTSSYDYIRKGTVTNLETQDQLEHDDYFSHSSMSAEIIKTYNSRLHLADIKRGFFGGFEQFSYSAYNNGQLNSLNVFVYIKTDDGERIIKKTISTREIIDIWYFYPDPRAYRVEFYSGNYLILSLPLTEHPYLHGAYYFNRLPDSLDGQLPSGTTRTPPTENNSKEELPNTLAVSEVDNPFVFTANGYHEVGTGKIVGLAIQTTALGQEEHGKHPLIVFMDNGILTMMVNDIGEYLRSDALSREVSINKDAITETDGAVFFASEKGLMLLVGNQVKCVSEQLSGKDGTFNGTTNLGNFIDFLGMAIIAYDYRDSLLWIFDKTHTACYVYSIKSGTFGKFDFGTGNAVTNVVNNYPDYLIQNSSGVYSLLDRENINDDADTYASTIISRPMKLENALALKSIMQIKHIHDMNDNATLALRIFASNNLKNWVELHSLRGTPWKYYRFRYDFSGLKATDRFAGTMLVTQERRTDKLR